MRHTCVQVRSDSCAYGRVSCYFSFLIFFLVIAFSARFVFRQSPSALICLWQVFVDVDVILGLLLVLVVIFVVLVSSSCSPSRSSGVFFSFSFFWVLLLAVIYDDNRMGGAFDFFFILNMTSSWSSCSSASSSTCTSCSLVLLGGSAMSTLPCDVCVWLTCAFVRSKRGETQLVCWCAFLESAWCPVWDPRRQPGAWGGAAAGSLARILAGVRAGGSNPDRGHGRVKPGSGKGQVKAGSGTRAGQIQKGKGRHKKEKTDVGMLVFTSGF